MGNCVSPQNRHESIRNNGIINGPPHSHNMANQHLIQKKSSNGSRSQSTPRMYHVNVNNGYGPDPSNPNGTCLIALYVYDSRSDGDLSFQKGDIMYLIDGSNADWWYVKKEKDGSAGYVPRNFVARFRTVESEE